MVFSMKRPVLVVASLFASAALVSGSNTPLVREESAKATCTVETAADGPDVYVLSGVSERPFDCLAVVNDDPPLSAKEVISDTQLTQEVCNLQKKPHITSYAESLVETVEKCKWECRPSTLRCVKTPDDDDTSCDCVNTGPRPAIVPLSEEASVQLFVQSASGSALQSELCANRNPGDVIGAEVNCQAITKDYPAMSLQRLLNPRSGKRDLPVCSYQPNPKADETYTVYTKMLPGSTGQACNYVCKVDNTLKCGSGDLDDNEQCICDNAGTLLPKLVPIDDAGVTRMVVHEDGSKSYNAEGGCFVRDGVDSCGDCGKCIEETGTCALTEPNLYEKNVCPCGFVCPRDVVISSRPAGSHGAPIMCEVNEALSKEPCNGRGTERPDMCLESAESDLEDQCACAKTHKEILGLEEEVGNNRCVPIE